MEPRGSRRAAPERLPARRCPGDVRLGRDRLLAVHGDWCRKMRGVDPAASLRGRYRTALGAMRHVRRLGGFEAMARKLMAGCGFATTETPGPAMSASSSTRSLVPCSPSAARWAGR